MNMVRIAAELSVIFAQISQIFEPFGDARSFEDQFLEMRSEVVRNGVRKNFALYNSLWSTRAASGVFNINKEVAGVDAGGNEVLFTLLVKV